MGAACGRCADKAREAAGRKPTYVADLSNAVSAPTLVRSNYARTLGFSLAHGQGIV